MTDEEPNTTDGSTDSDNGLDYNEIANDVYDRLTDEAQSEVNVEDLVEQVRVLNEEYRIPDEQSIKNSLVNNIADEVGYDDPQKVMTSQESGTTFRELDEVREFLRERLTSEREEVDEGTDDADIEVQTWVNLRVNVLNEFDDIPNSMAQNGYIGDDTNTMEFIIWDSSDISPLDVGQSYEIESAVATLNAEYGFSLNINSASEVEEIDTEFDVPSNNFEGYGIIAELNKEDPFVHYDEEGQAHDDEDDVDGETERGLHVRGSFYTQDKTYQIFLDEEDIQEMTAALEGEVDSAREITVEDAFEIANDKLDREAPVDEIERILQGHFFYMEGGLTESQDAFYVNETERPEDVEFSTEEAEQLSSTARSLQISYDEDEMPAVAEVDDGEDESRVKEPAVRVLSAEFDAVNTIEAEENGGQHATKFAPLPSGGKASRIVVVGPLLELEENPSQDGTYWSIQVNDASGNNYRAFAGRFQEDVVNAANRIKDDYNPSQPPIVALIGKPRMVEPEDEDSEAWFKLQPEALSVVSDTSESVDRDLWMREAVEGTIGRFKRMNEEFNSDEISPEVARAIELYDDEEREDVLEGLVSALDNYTAE